MVHVARPSDAPSEGARLAELSRAIRVSTLKRLRLVEPGDEGFRPSSGSLRIADIAHHLIRADDWLFAKLLDPSLPGMVARAGEAGALDPSHFRELLRQLSASGERRAATLARLTPSELATLVPDSRFGGEVSVWWVIVRGNLDHEAHHRGQLAAYLRILADQRNDGSTKEEVP